jgi:glycosyltransferase involved in cell wall biosynthesis
MNLAASGSVAADGIELLQAWKEISIELRAKERVQVSEDARLHFQRSIRHSKPRVLFVSVPSAFSGGEHNLCRTVRCLDKSRYEVFAYIGKKGLFSQTLEEAGCKLTVAGEEFGACHTDNFFRALKILTDLQPDIVHSNGVAGCPFLYATKLLNIPFVQHVRLLDAERYRDAATHATAVIAVSGSVKEALLRLEIERERVHVIYNGIDINRFYPGAVEQDAARRELGISKDKLVVLVVSRYTLDKRHDTLLTACRDVATAVPQFHLILVGEAFASEVTNYERILKMAQDLELSEHITHLGFEPDIRRVYAVADVVALPAEREALGTCVLEGMAMKLPVVISDSGGLAEVVRDQVDGLVVRAGNAKELSGALIKMLADPVLRGRMGEEGRKRIESGLTAEASARSLMDVFESVLSRTRTSEAACAVLG